jgi:hypothetical protein
MAHRLLDIGDRVSDLNNAVVARAETKSIHRTPLVRKAFSAAAVPRA